MIYEPIPLHSVEAEEAFLGCLIGLTGPHLSAAVKGASTELFYLGAHRILFAAMRRQVESRGVVDIVPLKADLIAKNQFEEAGDDERLIRIMELAFRHPNWSYYLDIIRQNWQRRELRRMGQQISDLAQSDDETPQVLADVRRMLRSSVFDAGTEIPELATIELSEAGESGVSTGIKGLDELTGVGLVSGQTAVVAAYRKGGKTAFLVQLALTAMKAGLNVVYATLADLDPAQLKRRMLKQLCGLSRFPANTTFEAQRHYDEALGYLNDIFREGGCRIYDGAVHGKFVEDLSSKIVAHSMQNPPDLLCVDYVQKIHSRKRGARDGKTSEMEYVSEALKELAEELRCPVAIGSQVTFAERGGEASTKYAKAIEEDAGILMQIERFDDSKNGEPVLMTVGANRFGPSGKVDLFWDKNRVRFNS